MLLQVSVSPASGDFCRRKSPLPATCFQSVSCPLVDIVGSYFFQFGTFSCDRDRPVQMVLSYLVTIYKHVNISAAKCVKTLNALGRLREKIHPQNYTKCQPVSPEDSGVKVRASA